ncbi:MAG: glycosyltransferase family 39 protein [Phycisphaerales bacterium]|nr:glycosyltransferase family 39 protein [Phycisphaerales bacterium]
MNLEKRWWTREDILLLVMLGALLFLPGLGQIVLFDRDEPRFATAAREMWQSGDYIVPRFNGGLRSDKPPLVYWLMTASYSLMGQANELAARLPSAICGTLTLIVVYLMAAARFGRVTGLLAALILGSCSLFVVESRMATADAAMLLFTVICMACMWQAWDTTGKKPEARSQKPEGENSKCKIRNDDGNEPSQTDTNRHRQTPSGFRLQASGFWLALACGVLTKGVPLFFVLVPVVVLSLWQRFTGGNWRWWRNLKPMVGIPLLMALVLWWVVLAGMQTHWDLIRQMVGVHFFARVAGPLAKWLPFQIQDVPRTGGNDPMGSYSKPPGFYLLMVWVTFWPWSVLLVPTAFHTVKRVLGKTALVVDPRPYRFLLAWIVPMWICLEIARGKLLHYPLPQYVGIAILCADALVQSWHRLTDVFAAKWFGGGRWLMLAIWVGLAAAVLIVAKQAKEAELFWRCIPLAGAFVAAGVAQAIAWDRPSWPFVTVLGWAAALLVLFALVLPAIEGIQVSRAIGSAMQAEKRNDPELQLLAIGYEEPSLVFYAEHQIVMGPAAMEILAEPEARRFLAAVNSDSDPKHPGGLERLREKNVAFRIVMERRGFNPANQKLLRVLLITNEPEKATETEPTEAREVPPPSSSQSGE